MKRKKGFTLAELLIVVAIVAVLVAIAIPIFHSQLEKARRTVDLHTARSVESALVAAINDGSVELVNTNTNKPVGIWVTICRDKNSFPKDYSAGEYGTVFYGADPNVVVNGEKSGSWSANNKGVKKILDEAGMSAETLKTKSNDKDDGWDWIVIEVGYMDNQIFAKMYSGFKNQSSGAEQYKNKITNIEKMIEQK